jgi:hypothetical protein
MDIEALEFWPRQMMEHCLFVYLNLSSSDVIIGSPLMVEILGSDAKKPEIKNLLLVSPQVDQLKVMAMSLMNRWAGYLRENEAISDVIPAALPPLLKDTKFLKEEVVRLLTKKLWLGSMYPALATHILDELKHFEACISGTVTPEDEIAFWAWHNADDTGLVAHLIDPSEQELTDELLNAQVEGQAANSLGEVLSFVAKDIKTGQDIDRTKPRSIIYPLLALHEQREHLYCQKRLSLFEEV